MRAEEGGHLHELLRALQLIRLSAVDFMLEHDVGEGPLTAHAERDLEYRFSKFFDVVIYHFVRASSWSGRRWRPTRARLRERVG